MNVVLPSPECSDAERRKHIYDGDLFLLQGTDASRQFVDFACGMLEAAFGEYDPRRAQWHIPVEVFHGIFAPLKPAFIHHPRSWALLADMLKDLRCDPETTYLDVPRLRVSTSHNYLTSGVAYAHHPHRDTWYSAPMCQINWWMPLYTFTPENGMAFHPRYWREAVQNDSDLFNYYDWNSSQRKNAAKHVTSDTRWQPHALNPLQLEPDVRVVCPPGTALLFSAAQLHSTVPNTSGFSRYSVDFRTVDSDDVKARRGAFNVDSRPSGTSLRDFKRISDGARLPEDLVAQYDSGPSRGQGLIYEPVSAGGPP